MNKIRIQFKLEVNKLKFSIYLLDKIIIIKMDKFFKIKSKRLNLKKNFKVYKKKVINAIKLLYG